jgi:4-azaleucine resistance transporter AzlC
MTVTQGIRFAAPFADADFLDGVAFGVVAGGLGVPAAHAIVLSATAFSGTAQFASLTVLDGNGSLVAFLLVVLATNARYLAFGASVAPVLSRNPLRRAAEAQLLTDVSWALAVREEPPSRPILVGAGLASFVAWTAGTAAGALFGTGLGDYRSVGLDAALPAFFVCLLIERVRR